MTRKQQLWALIGLAALTTALQYALQGALATRADIGAFPGVFWTTDYVLWAIRSLVEAAVIVYLFTTQAKTRWQSFILTCFEIGLISLITVTLGPALRSIGMGKSVEASLAEVFIGKYNAGVLLFWLWNFGIAAYAPAMLASVGFAYRMQPTDNGHTLVDNGQLAAAQAELTRMHEALRLALANERSVKQQMAQAEEKIAQLAAEGNSRNTKVASALQAIAWIERQSPTVQIRLLTLASNGDKPTVKELSEWFRVTPPTASKARASVEAIVLKRESGE
jgi:hypothetical protein